MDRRDTVISDRPPNEATLKDGDREIYLDGQNLVEVIKANGVLFENIIGGDQSEPVLASGSGGIGNWESLDDGLYAGNLELLSDDAVLIAKDASGNARAKFGQIATDEFGLQVLSSGAAEIMGIYGTTANIAGWSLSSNSILKTITSGGVAKSVGLTTAASQPGFTLKIGSIERIKIGFLDTTEYGMEIKNSSGSTLVEIKADDDVSTVDVATIAGWTIAPSSLTGGVGATTIALAPGNAIWMGDASLGDAKFSVTNAGVLKAISGTIGGWDLTTNLLRSATDGGARVELNQAKNRVSIFDATSEKVTMGYLEGLGKNPIKGDATGGSTTTLIDTTANWTTNIFAGAFITIDSGTGSVTTKTVASNTSNTVTITTTWTAPDATSKYTISGWGNWGVGDYGFWAAAGDQLVIDGAVQYENGDWIIQHDASYLVNDSADNTIIRLGTDTGEKGLFLYNTSGTTLAKFHSGGFRIGSASGTANYLEYTSGGALTLAGTFKVQDEILPALAAWEKNVDWDSLSGTDSGANPGEAIIYGYSGNGVADKSVQGAFMYQGSKYLIQTRQGWNNTQGSNQDSPYKKLFTIATHSPSSGVLDGYIVYETLGGTGSQPSGVAANCPFSMIGLVDPDPYFRIAFCTRTTTVASNGTVTVVWKYDPNSASMTTFTPTSTMVVIGYMRVSTDEIDYMQMFREAVPIDIVQDAGGWADGNFNADGTSATLNTGVTINGGGIVIDDGGSIRSYGKTSLADTTNGFFLGTSDSGTSYDFAIGDATKHIKWDGSAATMTIRGSLNADDMTTGSIESSDGNTKFDLDGDVIIINDDSHDRVALGDIGGSGYGLKISAPGSTAVSADDDDLFLSSNWAVPKFTLLFGGASEKIDGSGLLDTAYATWVSGNCTTNNNAGTSMQDTSKTWEVNEFVGGTVVRTNAGYNAGSGTNDTTMRAYGIITSNTTNTLTHVALAGGYPGTANTVQDGNDWDNGDTYIISPKLWGRYSKSDSYYVGTKKQKLSLSTTTWIEDTEGTTIATFPYLHDKINKYIRLSAFLSSETSLRLGIYKQTWNTEDAQKLQLELAGTENKGRFVYGSTEIAALNIGDAVWTDNVTGTAFGQPAWYICTNGSVAHTHFGSAYLNIGLAGNGTVSSYFDEIYDKFPFVRMINSHASDGAYKVATLDLTSHLSAANPLRHGDLYIIRLTGGRTENTQRTDDSHLVIQPQVSVHGYDFNATAGNNST